MGRSRFWLYIERRYSKNRPRPQPVGDASPSIEDLVLPGIDVVQLSADGQAPVNDIPIPFDAPISFEQAPRRAPDVEGAQPRASLSRSVLILANGKQVAAYLHAYAEGNNLAADRQLHGDPSVQDEHLYDDDSPALRRARTLGLPLVRLESIKLDPNAVALVPPAVARNFHLVPVSLVSGVLGVAAELPADAELIPVLRVATHHRIALMVAEPQEIRAAISANYDRVEDMAILRHLGFEGTPNALPDATEEGARQLALQQPVVRLVSDILAAAARRRASDIHLRPGAEGTDLLYRIDNLLIPVRRFIKALNAAIVSRIKVIGSMNLAEHRLPQSGRASFTLENGHEIDLRMSVIPTSFGESVVIRLLDTTQGMRNVDQLGLSPADSTRFLDLLKRNHGMILVTGPTGSGKSTTLYAALLEARKEPINIVTVEDPVEYHIPDVQQVQVNRATGFTFARALPSILRHDPDIIMVGEIRDSETALIAVESALTGHLLLSTLHTNTAATTITRLLDLGVESFLLRSMLLGVLSQRLMRRNCPHCLELEIVPAHWREVLGVESDEPFYRGSGCLQCEGLGVRGRAAVYELLPITSAIRRLIVAHCETDRIQEAALSDGMVSITRNAVELARTGTISLSEAYRLRAD